MLLELIELSLIAAPITFLLVLLAVADKINFRFKPRWFWVGVYLQSSTWTLYLMFLPMCGIKFSLVPNDYMIVRYEKGYWLMFIGEHTDDSSEYRYWIQAFYAMRKHIDKESERIKQTYKDGL